jgi:dolichol-phosphate mannosyltransferase
MSDPTKTDFTRVAVVIPAFKVSNHLGDLLGRIGSQVNHIIVVDDFCPENSGQVALKAGEFDKRISVVFHNQNLGVGGAVKTGYREALRLDSEVIVKIDGDGQMDPDDIADLISPLIDHTASYSKGNRFYNIEVFTKMPKVRLLGNILLSFYSKLSTGYWSIFDPNNGFTAITSKTLKKIPLDKVDNRYFFESDMLFRLNLLNSNVVDVPLPARYGSEKSGLSVSRSIFEFFYKHNRNFVKRIIYSYFMREFSLASLQLLLGSTLIILGLSLGLYNFIHSRMNEMATPTGTLIIIAMSVLSGLQLLLGFFSYDMQRSFSRFSGNR